MGAIIPPGQVVWGLQLPIQSQSTQLRAAVGGRRRPRRARGDRAGRRPGRRALRRGLRPHRRAASGRRADVVDLVRHDRHARLARRASPSRCTCSATCTCCRTGTRSRRPRRSPLSTELSGGRAILGVGRRPPGARVRRARGRLRDPRVAGRRGDPGDPCCVRRGVPDRRWARRRGRRRHGAPSGPRRRPADLARWLVEGGDPPCRHARRRVAAAGSAPDGAERSARADPRRAGCGRAARGLRHRRHRRARLPGHPRLRGRAVHRDGQRRADRGAVPEARPRRA